MSVYHAISKPEPSPVALTQPQLGRGRRRNCETGLHGLVNKSRDYESKVSAEAAATRPP